MSGGYGAYGNSIWIRQSCGRCVNAGRTDRAERRVAASDRIHRPIYVLIRRTVDSGSESLRSAGADVRASWHNAGGNLPGRRGLLRGSPAVNQNKKQQNRRLMSGRRMRFLIVFSLR